MDIPKKRLMRVAIPDTSSDRKGDPHDFRIKVINNQKLF